MTTHIPQCLSCRHYTTDPREITCTAFPSGIPVQIWNNLFDHRRDWPGDNGIKYEPGNREDEE
jgi:hypothetical protein